MIQRMFSVYDTKAAAFMQPFFMPTDGMAIRAITDCVLDPKHGFSQHAADYTLFYLGVFNDDKAVFTVCDAPVNLGSLITFVDTAME